MGAREFGVPSCAWYSLVPYGTLPVSPLEAGLELVCQGGKRP